MRNQFSGMAIATLLWLVSTALGGIIMFQVYEVTRLVFTLLIPVDPEWTVVHGPQVTFVSRVVLFVLAISLIAVSILLLEKYQDSATEPRRLAKWFTVTTIIQLSILGLATMIIYVLPGSVLDVTS
jgi:hypothetical protein